MKNREEIIVRTVLRIGTCVAGMDRDDLNILSSCLDVGETNAQDFEKIDHRICDLLEHVSNRNITVGEFRDEVSRLIPNENCDFDNLSF